MAKKMYEVEIKSQELLRRGQRSLVTYFEGGTHQEIISNVKVLYPEYTKVEDQPVVNVTPIKRSEYNKRKKQNTIFQKQQMLHTTAFVMQEEDYETVGD